MLAESDPISEADRKAFNTRRVMTFIGMVAGYATYYFTRLSFTYTAPVMKAALDLDMIKIGTITTIFPVRRGGGGERECFLLVCLLKNIYI